MSAELITRINALKGAAISLVVVLMINQNKPMQAISLQAWTGYADKSITTAIVKLESMGMIEHTQQGFRLTQPKQLALLFTGNGSTLKDREIYGSYLPTINTNKLINGLVGRYEAPVNFTISPEENTQPVDNFGETVDNSEETVDNFSAGDEGELVESLKACGIGEPKLSQLAAMDGLTPEIVQGLRQELREKKGRAYKPGLLIYALERGERPSQAAMELDEDRNKYISGQFADFVEH